MFEEMVAEYVAAANAHDVGSVAGFMSDDVEYEDVPLGELLHGRPAVMDFFERGSQTLSSDAQVEVVSVAGADVAVTIEWVLSGTHDGVSPLLPATGRPFTIRGVTVAEVRDMMFSSYRDYYDMAGFLRQIGVLPSG